MYCTLIIVLYVVDDVCVVVGVGMVQGKSVHPRSNRSQPQSGRHISELSKPRKRLLKELDPVRFTKRETRQFALDTESHTT